MEPSPLPGPCFSRELDGDDDRLPAPGVLSFAIVPRLKLSCCCCLLLLLPLLPPSGGPPVSQPTPDATPAAVLRGPPASPPVLVLTPLTLSTSVDIVDVDEARALPFALAVSGGNLSRVSNLPPGESGCNGTSVFRNRYKSGVGLATLIDEDRLRLNTGDFWCFRKSLLALPTEQQQLPSWRQLPVGQLRAGMKEEQDPPRAA